MSNYRKMIKTDFGTPKKGVAGKNVVNNVEPLPPTKKNNNKRIEV